MINRIGTNGHFFAFSSLGLARFLVILVPARFCYRSYQKNNHSAMAIIVNNKNLSFNMQPIPAYSIRLYLKKEFWLTVLNTFEI
jgi:hypothetical protein